MYRLVCTCWCIAAQAPPQIPIRRPSKQGRLYCLAYVKSRLFRPTCVGDPFGGVCTGLRSIMYRFHFHRYGQHTLAHFPSRFQQQLNYNIFVLCISRGLRQATHIRLVCANFSVQALVYRLVGTDLYVQTRRYRRRCRFIFTSSSVQTRTYRSVCTG